MQFAKEWGILPFSNCASSSSAAAAGKRTVGSEESFCQGMLHGRLSYVGNKSLVNKRNDGIIIFQAKNGLQ